MGLVLLILLVILIVVFDKKIYKTYYTPSIMLSVPFLTICILYDLNAENLGYFPLNYNVLYIWVFGLLFFWFTGVLTGKLFPSKKLDLQHYDVNKNKKILVKYNRYPVNLLFVVSLFLTYTLRQAYGIYLSAGGDAVENYLGSGIQGHLLIVVKFFSILSFLSLFIRTSVLTKFKNSFVIFISIALSLLYGTKSGILILVLSYYFSWSIFFNKKMKIYHVLFGLVLGFIVFFFSYSLIFGRLAPLDFIWEHMTMYLISGTAGMNAYFSNNGQHGVEPEMLFRSLFNIMSLITGNSEDIKNVISEKWTFIGTGPLVNVKTFFGTIYLYGGVGSGLFAVCIFSFLSYSILKKVINNGDLLLVALYVYLLSTFCFGWFDFYLNTIALYEYVAIVIIFSFMSKRKYI